MSSSLEPFGVDLTIAAAGGRLDPVFGREAEIARVIRVLTRKTKNNAVLLGPPGVGKTAIVEGLAHRIVATEVPATLIGTRIFSLSLGSLLAGTGYRGDFEQRLQGLVQELRKPGAPRILFVDEIHLLAKAGRSEGGIDAGNLLKPLLARGELPCIGASTTEEWQAMIATDPALERRFQPVEIREPNAEETLGIVRRLKPNYEAHHGIEILDEALVAAVRESAGFARNRCYPDKAIDVLDEACAMVRLETAGLPGRHDDAADAERRAGVRTFDLERVAHAMRHARTAATRATPRVDEGAILKAIRSMRTETEPG